MNKNPRLQFVHQLEEHIRQYLIKLEQMLGPRDPRFVFGTVRLTTNENGSPQTYARNGSFHFNGNCIVDVHIGIWPWKVLSPGQSVWQVAHESVHLLDPGPLGTNFLEEGLATWFQDELKFHNEKVRRYIARNKEHDRPYAEAKKLVLACKPESHLCFAVKKIRASGVRIRDIEEEVLGSHLSRVNDSIIERLCAPFPLK